MAKDVGVASDGNFRSCLIGRSWYNHFLSFSMGGNRNNPIYSIFMQMDGARGTLWINGIKDYFLLIKWSHLAPKNSIFMQGLKSTILANFPEIADWLDWPCPISAALHYASIENDRKWLYQILPITYESKWPAELMPGLMLFRSGSKQCD